MYLKNIEVYGFKSFAQKINFEFHNGITGIVGPNGSGKSNVGDAVRWVLGEQSAKQLRGGNMQDVIFSGTESRKPLSFASVAITLDNSDHKLPVDFNEVTVARRLYRSGESEYLINGSSCRLKDIQEMFYDTGIGKEGYSIIGQGQIDKILSGKPEDRRELFDEAAGIVKFKRRKNTTIKKLEEERQNLVRVTDILSELTKQLGPLEKQSETARIYLAKREELKTLDVNLFLLEYEQSGQNLEELEQKLSNAQRELDEAQKAYDRTKAEYERLEEELETLNERLDSLKEEQQQNALGKQQFEGQMQVLEEQILAGRQSSEHFKSRLATLKEELAHRREEQENLSEEKLTLHEKLKEIRKSLKEEEKELENIVSNVEECTSAVEDGKNEIIEILNSRATTKGKAQRFDAMIEQLDIRKAEVSQRILRLKSEEEVLENDRSRYQQAYDEITASIQEVNEECTRLSGEVQKLQTKLQEQSREIEAGQTAYHREASRLESLRNITERYDGYGNSIRRVMEQKAKEPGIRGVVADIIHVQKDYEVAIETALGGSIQNVVTDNEQTAKRMIGFLKQNRYGRATFLPLSNISGRGGFTQRDALKEPGVIGTANTLVQADAEYSELVQYLLGRVLVVDNIDHAIAIGKKYRHSLRMVTIEGESLSPGGSMTGGAFRNSSNLLGRRREIEELKASAAQISDSLDKLKGELADTRKKLASIREDNEAAGKSMREQQIAYNTAQMNYKQASQKRDEIIASYQESASEAAKLDKQIEDIRGGLSDVTSSLASLDDKNTLAQEKAAELNSRLEAKRNEETGHIARTEGIHVQFNSLQQKDTYLQENITRIEWDIENLQNEEKGLNEQLANTADEIKAKEDMIARTKAAIEAAQTKIEECEKSIAALREKRAEVSEQNKTFFDKRENLANTISALDKECYRLNAAKEKLEAAKDGLVDYMWSEYEITYGSASQLRDPEMTDLASIKKTIASVKAQIRALGDVNVNAIEEYKDVNERYTFLSTQHDDLIKAEQSLMTVIDELDNGMRIQFKAKFEEIKTEFDKVFRELFGGGRGTIELVEGEDILEAGIVIISQPPGKKLQNMMQLSGGEKALTAISLLFAIQNLKPSPFCLLDEIEAALDDSNVDRYASYLHKLTKHTQFIVITHRRGTMAAADRLYGITMQEKGVSTLVSVDLIENELDASDRKQ